MITTLIILSVAALTVLFIVVMLLNKNSYKHECFIIIPTGDNLNECVIERDKFKVRQEKGHYQIWFYKHRGKAYSPPTNFWTKFWTNKKKPFPDNQELILNTTEEELRKYITRGAIFAKVGEREYKPAKIRADGDIQVIDHDTMELFLDDIEREKELTTSWKDKLLALGLWLGSLLIIALLAIVILVLTMKYTGEQSTAIIETARAAIAAQAGVGG